MSWGQVWMMNAADFLTVRGANAFTAPFFGVVASDLDAKMLPAKYAAMAQNQTLLPGPDAMVQCWLNGSITDSSLTEGMKRHNIRIGPNAEAGWFANHKAWWNNVLDGQIPKLPLQALYWAYYAGYIDDDQWKQLIKRYKFRSEQADILKWSMYGTFTPLDAVISYFRGAWDEDLTIRRIRKAMHCNEKDARDILNNNRFIPPPTDLIRFAYRDVFDEAVRKRDNLEAEFSDQKDLREWFGAQGIGEVTINKGKPSEKTLDLPLAYWVAHWQLPSPGQVYEMLHRLRNMERAKRLGITNPKDIVTLQTVRDLLKQNDFAPIWRNRLAAISYRVPRLIDIRNMYMKEVIDKTELIEKLQDRGYSEQDARETANYYEKNKKDADDKEEKRKAAKAYGKLRAAILEAYRIGATDRATAYNTLIGTDMEADEAESTLTAIDLQVNSGLVKQYISMTKSAFMLGGYDGFQGYAALREVGVREARASQYVQLWQRQMTLPRKALSVSKVVEYTADGKIPIGEARIRLANLGYPTTDAQYLLLEAYEKAQEKALKLQIAEQKDAEKARKAAEALQRRAEAAREKAIKEYASVVTLPRMTQWYRLGLIDKQYVYDNLIYVGWPEREAQIAIDALPDRSTDNG